MMFASNTLKHLIFIITFVLHQSIIHCSYRYAGCFTQVFYDSLFTSSYMEPTLCFRLCDTPIVYLQKTICRCSGAGLMHHDRQEDKFCSYRCSTVANRRGETNNTCGGQQTYSAYIQHEYFLRHRHLFNHQIDFFACELWNKTNIYDTIEIDFDDITTTDMLLHKMEQCAAACLDRNVTTKSIAFNGNPDKCLCILPWNIDTKLKRTYQLTTMTEDSCNQYCTYTTDESKTESEFRCGSQNNSKVWAIYNLNGICPDDFQYNQEMDRCFYKYKYYWDQCPVGTRSFIFDEDFTWEKLLKLVQFLQLSNETVQINFESNLIVSALWKCASNSYNDSSATIRPANPYNPYGSRFSYLHQNWYGYRHAYRYYSRQGYILEGGCLKQSFLLYPRAYRICVADPLNKYASTVDDEFNSTLIETTFESTPRFCPANWIDLNGRCYRMSEENKTIEQARSSCITLTDQNQNDISQTWENEEVYDDNDDEQQLYQTSTGQIVEYVTDWQARLGFFLMDAFLPTKNTDSSAEKENVYFEGLVSSPRETIIPMSNNRFFQMADFNSSSCVIFNRTILNADERPLLSHKTIANCTKSERVLCETKDLIVQDFQFGCYQKPYTLNLPALISNRMSYELCLSVCQQLQTQIALINSDRCYCLESGSIRIRNLTADFQSYRKDHCGDVCLGNQHEHCGNEDTAVVFYILNSKDETHANHHTYPDFQFDSCVYVQSFPSIRTYQFILTGDEDRHPRRCLQLCTKYEQKYAFLQRDQCFCTNIQLELTDGLTGILENESCDQKCSSNYFYSCGNRANSSIYSMYVMQPKCRHGFEIAENGQQCVYSHFSSKTKSFSQAKAYCQSLGGQIAKVNNILEMEDILPQSIFISFFPRVLPFKNLGELLNTAKYFWFDRTNDTQNERARSERFLSNCSSVSRRIDSNCLAIRFGKTATNSTESFRTCISESDQCSIQSAIPVCIDKSIEKTNALVNPMNENNPEITVEIAAEYNCGEDPNYHLFDEHCYKISFHEISWINARSECEREGATLFVPETDLTLKIIRSLFLRRRSYVSSGFAHVGVMYDLQNRTVRQYTAADEEVIELIPDSNVIYDLCEKTFQQVYLSKHFTSNDLIGCAYVDLLSTTSPVIRCDEIPCNRTATVICQKSPIIVNDTIRARRKLIDRSTNMFPSDDDMEEVTQSVLRDFAPIFFVLSISIVFILLALISKFYNHRFYGRNTELFTSGRRRTNGVYSQLTSTNEFDLN